MKKTEWYYLLGVGVGVACATVAIVILGPAGPPGVLFAVWLLYGWAKIREKVSP